MEITNQRALVIICCVSVVTISYLVLNFRVKLTYILQHMDHLRYHFYCSKYVNCIDLFPQSSHNQLTTFLSFNFERAQCIRMKNMKYSTLKYDLEGVDRRRNLSLKEYLDVYDGKW